MHRNCIKMIRYLMKRSERERGKTPVCIVDFSRVCIVFMLNKTQQNSTIYKRENFKKKLINKKQFKKKWKNERNIKTPIAAIVTIKLSESFDNVYGMRTHTIYTLTSTQMVVYRWKRKCLCLNYRHFVFLHFFILCMINLRHCLMPSPWRYHKHLFINGKRQRIKPEIFFFKLISSFSF